jgi:hypothetical protein
MRVGRDVIEALRPVLSGRRYDEPLLCRWRMKQVRKSESRGLIWVRDYRGMYLTVASFSLFGLATAIQYTTASAGTFLACYALGTAFLTSWIGCAFATGQDLVLPRMRGVSFAVLLLGGGVIGLGTGPYCIGLISDITGDLRAAILSSLTVFAPACVGLLYLTRHLPEQEASVLDRARSAGEPLS